MLPKKENKASPKKNRARPERRPAASQDELVRLGEDTRTAKGAIQEVVGSLAKERNGSDAASDAQWIELSQTFNAILLSSHRLSSIYHRVFEDFTGDLYRFLRTAEIGLEEKSKELSSYKTGINTDQDRRRAEELAEKLLKLESQLSVASHSCALERKALKREGLRTITNKAVFIEVARLCFKPFTILPAGAKLDARMHRVTGQYFDTSREKLHDTRENLALRERAVVCAGNVLTTMLSSSIADIWKEFLKQIDVIQEAQNQKQSEESFFSELDKSNEKVKALSKTLLAYVTALHESNKRTEPR